MEGRALEMLLWFMFEAELRLWVELKMMKTVLVRDAACVPRIEGVV